MVGPLRNKFEVGTLVSLVERDALEHFLSTARSHPLTAEQLEYSGLKAVVSEVCVAEGGYHLYLLENLPGRWPESCLRATEVGHAYDHHEGTPLWRAIEGVIRTLEENRDIEVTAARSQVIGAICEQLSRLRLVK